MFIEPIFLYVFFVIIFLLILLLTVVIATQLFIFRKFSDIKRSNEHLRSSLAGKEGELLKKAREEAEEIIKKAIKQATQIEKDAKVNQKEFSELLQRRTETVTEHAVEKLQAATDSLLADFEKTLSKHSEEGFAKMETVTKELESQTVKAMGEEVARQKEERLKTLEEKIYQITKEAVAEIIGGSISLPLQEELIAEAVEKASGKEGL